MRSRSITAEHGFGLVNSGVPLASAGFEDDRQHLQAIGADHARRILGDEFGDLRRQALGTDAVGPVELGLPDHLQAFGMNQVEVADDIGTVVAGFLENELAV